MHSSAIALLFVTASPATLPAGEVVPLVDMHRSIAPGQPPPAQPACEDETGRLFREGPTSFVDGIRPQGYCGPPGWREEQALRDQVNRPRSR